MHGVCMPSRGQHCSVGHRLRRSLGARFHACRASEDTTLHTTRSPFQSQVDKLSHTTPNVEKYIVACCCVRRSTGEGGR